MIDITNTRTSGWEVAIRGMRNPMNSWDKSDSAFSFVDGKYRDILGNDVSSVVVTSPYAAFKSDVMVYIGPKDYALMEKLVKANHPAHSKWRRFVIASADVVAPLYWWKDYDTYKVGTVANGCSTMHRIQEKEFTIDQFSHEHLNEDSMEELYRTIDILNKYRLEYLRTNKKNDWWQMIQMLPSSYNQRRTISLSYEVLANIYLNREDHKLDEFRGFCHWICLLPCSQLITLTADIYKQRGYKA